MDDVGDADDDPWAQYHFLRSAAVCPFVARVNSLVLVRCPLPTRGKGKQQVFHMTARMRRRNLAYQTRPARTTMIDVTCAKLINPATIKININF